MCIIERNCEIIGETKIPADVSLIIKFIENAKKSVDSDDVQIKTGYEAGCLGYSLYWQLAEKGIECDILAPSTMHRSAKNKVVKNDRRDAKVLLQENICMIIIFMILLILRMSHFSQECKL